MKSFREIIAEDRLVLVDFYADWCGPCKLMPPILRELKDELGDLVTIIKIDVDKNPQVAAAYQVRGIPTLIVFKKGQVQWRTSGVVLAPQLKQKLQEFN